MESSELSAIKAELAEIKEILSSFTADGLPLRSQVPTSELIASLVAAASLIMRDRPLPVGELNERIRAAQVLATELIRQSDHYQRATQADQLSHLLPSG